MATAFIRRYTLIWFSGLSLTLPLATASEVTLSVEKTTLTLEDTLQVQVSVEGGGRTGEPELKNIDSFDVQSSGTSSKFNLINGQMSSEQVFSYVFTPKQAGTFTIGPAFVTSGGKTFQSGTATLTIQNIASPQTAGEPPQDKYLFLQTDIEPRKVFIQQQVTYRFRFFNRASLENARLSLPSFQGFLKEELEKQREYTQVVNGIRWNITQMQLALFPLSEGSYPIEAAKLLADVLVKSRRFDPFGFDEDFGFFGGRSKRVTLQSQPVTVDVQPLPLQAKPPRFGNLVGKYRLTASLSPSALKRGESTTLTTTLEGEGYAKNFSLPPLQMAELKSYEDKPVAEIQSRGGKIITKKTFKQALVPLKPGKVDIPAVEIDTFDPLTQRYEKTKSTGFTLLVDSGRDSETLSHVASPSSGSHKKSVELEGKDLMPIHKQTGTLRSDGPDHLEAWVLMLMVCLGPMLFFSTVFIHRWHLATRANSRGVRRQRAYKIFKKSLKALQTDGQFFEEASQAFRVYLGDRFNIDGKALTAVDAENKLKALGVSDQYTIRIRKLLESFEALQYGGSLENSKDREYLLQSMEEVTATLEREVRG